MGKALSADLRERLFEAMSEGMSRRAAAARFGVAASTAVRLQARYDKTRSLQPAKQGCPAGRGKLAPHGDFIIAEVEKNPDITLPELAGLLEAAHQVRADPSALSRFLCKHGFSYKKNTAGIGTRTR